MSGSSSLAAAPEPSALQAARGISPHQRAWGRFKRNRLGYWSLWLFIGNGNANFINCS